MPKVLLSDIEYETWVALKSRGPADRAERMEERSFGVSREEGRVSMRRAWINRPKPRREERGSQL